MPRRSASERGLRPIEEEARACSGDGFHGEPAAARRRVLADVTLAAPPGEKRCTPISNARFMRDGLRLMLDGPPLDFRRFAEMPRQMMARRRDDTRRRDFREMRRLLAASEPESMQPAIDGGPPARAMRCRLLAYRALRHRRRAPLLRAKTDARQEALRGAMWLALIYRLAPRRAHTAGARGELLR